MRAAVTGGTLSAGRIESYHKLQAEAAHQSRQIDQRAQIQEKRRSKSAAKALNKRVQEKGRE